MSTELHSAIMNLPCGVADTKVESFKDYALGHRDARHAAAELANEHDAELSAARKRIGELEAERDEADRFAGAARRRIDDLEDAARKRARWLWEAKQQWGVDDNVSFDVVWAEALALKAAALAQPKEQA